MKKIYLLSFFLGALFTAKQSTGQTYFNTYQSEMDVAYQMFPAVPKGVLEAWSFTTTHFSHLDESIQEGCSGIPKTYTVFGLTDDGKGYFRESLDNVSTLSGYSIESIKSNPQTGILAFAAAYDNLLTQYGISSSDPKDHITVFQALTQFPLDHNPINNFAFNSHVYEILNFLNKSDNQAAYSFQNYNIDLVAVFTQANYDVLSSTNVTATPASIGNGSGQNYSAIATKSPDFPAGIWNPAPTCNYSSRSGTAISALTVHTIQGSYAGAISWSQNCSSNVSYHYVVRSSDGQTTQMVYESDKAWHVGSANPYAIGIEHEGYVTDASWYTTALYTASAAIAIDVTQSGYGMLPIRTYYGASSTGNDVLGACTQIKGHQHFPSQSHTDPGINWDWPRYYNLVNPFVAPAANTTASGTIYDTGGASGNYTDDEREFYLIQPTGASNVTINFNQFDIEDSWDYLLVYDGATPSASLLGTFTGTTNPGTISSTGGALLIEFRSDCATSQAGYEITWSSTNSGGGTVTDVTAPITGVTVGGVWQTTNFISSFTDADEAGGSGIHHQLYQVIDFDGTDWRANNASGFYSDNFDNALHSDWISSTGTWTISGGYLDQADQTLSNTNIYSPLNQNNDDQWLFHYAMKIDGTGTNRRAGFHFMSDDASQTERGNSYFVWFRTDNAKVQIYKTTSNAFSLEQDIPFTINNAQWYDVKILFDKITGEISVWMNNTLVTTWIDPSPYTVGNDISFRSGDASYQVNNFKAYHSRGTMETVTVGAGNEIRYQNTNPTTPSAKVKSITIDSAGNVSSISDQTVDIDWTAPNAVPNLKDGAIAGSDIATQPYTTKISANWNSSTDPHSAISRYWYAVGTSAGATDIVNWTDNWTDTSFTHLGLQLTAGSTYYTSVKAENGAGLINTEVSSNGVTVDVPVGTPDAAFVIYNSTVCLGEAVTLTNSSSNATSYAWSVSGGTLSSSSALNPDAFFTTSGTYTISLTATGPGGSDVSTQSISVQVNNPAVANASPSGSIVQNGSTVNFTNSSTNANGYFWDFGDGNTSTDLNPWNIYADTGSYQVMLVAINGVCDNDTAYFNIDVIDNVGITNVEGINSVSIIPNPNNGSFQLDLWATENISASVTIFDINGKLIEQPISTKELTSGKNSILINSDQMNLSNGVYNLRIQTTNGMINKRFIIKK
jgi:PKD repeat protein